MMLWLEDHGFPTGIWRVAEDSLAIRNILRAGRRSHSHSESDAPRLVSRSFGLLHGSFNLETGPVCPIPLSPMPVLKLCWRPQPNCGLIC